MEKLYLVANKDGYVYSPVMEEDVRKTDTIIAVFGNDLFYTAEEKFWLFDEFVKEQEGKCYTMYSILQLKELHQMWLESLN